MTFDEFNSAVRDAKSTVEFGDRAVRNVIGLASGRLRVSDIDRYTLKALKRELQDFDAVRGRWKEPK